ncbi:POK19 protein, partial [Rissa tridactyla]|nr:POK19 protein [Rissa tridactyla]
KLLGAINWVRPLLGIPNHELSPLFSLLKGNSDLLSPRNLTPEAQLALAKVSKAVASRQVDRMCLSLPFQMVILNPSVQPYALIYQWDETRSDPLIYI